MSEDEPVEKEVRDYRVRYIRKGGHVHCRVFSRPRTYKPVNDATWQGLGTLTLGAAEWTSFQNRFNAEYLPEPE